MPEAQVSSNPLDPPVIPEIAPPEQRLPVRNLQRTAQAVVDYLFVNPDDHERVQAAFEAIVKLCRAGCHGLSIPGAGGQGSEEHVQAFIRMWIVEKTTPLLKLATAEILDLATSGIWDYWSHECRCDLLNEIAKLRLRLNPVSLDGEPGLPYRELWVTDGSMGSSLGVLETPKVELDPETLNKYISENLPAIMALGKTSAVLIAAAKALPARNVAAFIGKLMGVSEREARRRLKNLQTVVQKEIVNGNSVIRGLFNLLRNGDDILPEYRRPWNNGPCKMDSVIA